jgi:hypothetical protein
MLGAGYDVLGEPGAPVLPPGRRSVGEAAVEVWRIRAGTPRMGADFDRSSIPAEAGLEALIDVTKGCFLGQESVARVRNLGHPPRVLRHLQTEGSVGAGAPLTAGSAERDAVVTSAAERRGGGTVLLASVRWSAREGSLRTSDGLPVIPVGSSD